MLSFLTVLHSDLGEALWILFFFPSKRSDALAGLHLCLVSQSRSRREMLSEQLGLHVAGLGEGEELNEVFFDSKWH